MNIFVHTRFWLALLASIGSVQALWNPAYSFSNYFLGPWLHANFSRLHSEFKSENQGAVQVSVSKNVQDIYPDNVFATVLAEATQYVNSIEENRNQSYFRGANGHGLEGHNYCKFTPLSERIRRVSNIHIRAYEILTSRYNMEREKVLRYLNSKLPRECSTKVSKTPFCDINARYRSYDGTCNDHQNPYWGASYTAFNRLLPAVYNDGWNEPRGAKSNARVVSVLVHSDYVNPDKKLTNMVAQVGQFLDHDITLTPEADRRCCSYDSRDLDCWNINIPTDDPFFSKLRNPKTCMDFTRSTAYCFPSLTGVREQMNIITAFVDASHIYASEEDRTNLLRSFQGGRLRVNSQNPNFLPTVAEVKAELQQDFEFMGTFLGGEQRVNEMPALTVMHTLLFREHNRLADQIVTIKPYWNDETVFQEARRLLIAEWQNIIFGEFLPIILGNQAMNTYGLTLESNNLYSDYNPKMNPTIFHAFADAAFRFGHTLINGLIRMLNGFQDISSYRIRDAFFNDQQILMHNGKGYDYILSGLMQQNAQTYDPFVTEDVTNFLLREKHQDHGGDLIARNIQRGRDHGLPNYNAYRQYCRLSGLSNSWTNCPSNIPHSTWKALQIVYETPLDIDLFTGGLSETPVTGGVTGSTFNCLKALQFQRIKFGDRYFFTHKSNPAPFSPEQVTELRKRTLGDVMCDNSDVEMTTRNVFISPSVDNPMMYCDDPSRNRFKIEMFF